MSRFGKSAMRHMRHIFTSILVAIFILFILPVGGPQGVTGIAAASSAGGVEPTDKADAEDGGTALPDELLPGGNAMGAVGEAESYVDPAKTIPPPDMTVNGTRWAPKGAFVTGQVLMTPFEETCKVLGARGFFDDFTQVMRVHRPGTMLQLAVRSTSMTVNGERKDLPLAPVRIDGTVFVPVRALAEGLGCRVTWDEANKCVTIKLPEASGPSGPGEVSRGDGIDRDNNGWVISCSEEEYNLLASVIDAEAADEPFEGQVAVGAVIVNRVKSPHFPNTIREVIFQPGQFKVIENGRYKQALTGRGKEAALAALRGEDPSRGALYFFNPRVAKSPFLFKRPVTVEIGSHRFTQ
ncbi:MAG TPA: hypothetical protein GX507_05155 [Clostridia bacterium]|nr:hypothetical protein [Clostridia bacterium]